MGGGGNGKKRQCVQSSGSKRRSLNQSEMEKREKKNGGEGSSKSIRSPSRAPVRAGARWVGWETGEQGPRSLDKDLGQQKSGKGGVWEPGGAQGQQEGLAEPHPWAEGHLLAQTFLAGWEVRGHFSLHLKLTLPRALFPP